ncbi:MAG: phytanoyl-CoA dioxygenase family protein [Planctomycetota bacterium]
MLDPLEAYALDLQGYLVVKGAFAPDLVRRLGDALVGLEQRPAHEVPRDCPVSWTPVVNEVRFLNVLAAAPVFAEPIDHPAVLPRVREIVPGPARLTEAFSITRGRGIGLKLHSIETASYRCSDGRPRCDHLTAVVALTDCGPEDGPFVVFAGTHKLGVPFPYPTVHPGWRVPPHDRAAAAAERALQPSRTRELPWETSPGYTEVCVEAGDLVLFVQSLWHGAKEVRSGRVRRSLFYSYSPYHMCNWHGVEWSGELRARQSPERRQLLGGPFLGSRYPGIDAADLPDDSRFPMLGDSERGPRAFVDEPDPASTTDPIAAIEQRFLRVFTGREVAVQRGSEILGRCRFDVRNTVHRGWTVALVRGALREECIATDAIDLDAVVEGSAADLAAVLVDGLDPSELFHGGRVRVSGDVGLAMRIASLIGS